MKRAVIHAVLLLVAVMQTSLSKGQEFPMISIPSFYVDASARATYLTEHYWDRFDFSNQTLLVSSATEQGFVDMIPVLDMVPYSTAEKGIKTMLDKASKSAESYDRIMELCERYFYDPNSPMRNDEYYIPCLKHAIGSSLVEEVMKTKYRSHLQLAQRNRPATTATDFAYTLANGTQGRLSGVKAEYTILFFYNPDCDNCREVKMRLNTAQSINSLHQQQRIAVLAVYPDADLTAWRAGLKSNPQWWISSYDKGTLIEKRGLYDLKAIPSLYLLDRDKRVLLKDATPEILLDYLDNVK